VPEKTLTWDCEFCSRAFVHENAFMKHHCPQRERLDELRSSVGQTAYAHYSEWMKQKKRSVPPIETFATSKLYTTFIKFAEHAACSNIPNVKQFIKLMVEHNDVSPTLWTRDNIYALYLEWYDDGYSPEQQVLESVEFIQQLALDYECTPSWIFKVVPVDTLVLHIKRRKISPWFLMSSSVFRRHLLLCESEDKDKLERALNAGAMINRIQRNPDLFRFFNRVTSEVGL
jgi:phage/plasmid-associated DNA primase